MEIPSEILEKARLDLQRAETVERRAQEALENAREERVRLSHFLEQCERYAVEGSRPEGRAGSTSQSSALVEAAIEAITDNGPMGIADLHDALIARGLKIGGQKPRSNLAGFLSRGSATGSNIEYEDGVGWRLRYMPSSHRTTAAKPIETPFVSKSNQTLRPVASQPNGVNSIQDAPRGGDLDDEIPF